MNGYRAVQQAKRLSPGEFVTPAGESFADRLHHVSGELIRDVDELIEAYGPPVHPSRNPDGIARFTGSRTSRHSAQGRLCDAIDLFPSDDVASFVIAALTSGKFRGIGVYGDTTIAPPTQPYAMVHLDQRPGRLVFWARLGGQYIYKHDDEPRFYRALMEALNHGRV